MGSTHNVLMDNTANTKMSPGRLTVSIMYGKLANGKSVARPTIGFIKVCSRARAQPFPDAGFKILKCFPTRYPWLINRKKKFICRKICIYCYI